LIQEELLQAYISTSYKSKEHDNIVLRVGQFNPNLKILFQQYSVNSCVFITAWNPFSSLQTIEENKNLNGKLLTYLKRKKFIFFEGIGEGDDEKWPGEESYLILDVDKSQALSLGQNFNQNAIIWTGASAIPELVICI
jgi:hypothetical protein